jgi:acyl-CoA reductase-like NAD-dependent aldehyde dehydrogenase
MATRTEVEQLCRAALEEESNWRDGDVEERKNAFERFQDLVHKIADVTGRTYEDVMNDAIEEWVKVHFCELPVEHEPAAEWEHAGQEEHAKG